jgi:hypothetical protein
MGLKPVFKPVCPVQGCTFELRYHVRDESVHPDNWAMTSETYAHLNEPHYVMPVRSLHAVSELEELPNAA